MKNSPAPKDSHDKRAGWAHRLRHSGYQQVGHLYLSLFSDAEFTWKRKAK